MANSFAPVPGRRPAQKTRPARAISQRAYTRGVKTERHEYEHGAIGEEGLLSDPIAQLQIWLDEVRDSGTVEPTAMSLATVDPDGRPSNRIVLLRGLDARGLVFYTNYLSHKGQALAANPFAAVTFWWGGMERQVRVEGAIERVPAAEADAYFEGRPIKSRYASAISPQSKVIGSREELEVKMAELQEAYPEGPPRPDHWGGYLLIPEKIEFWQGRRARLHDRFLYSRTDAAWDIVRLAP
ncbi:pyridoxamine 5'-phosphate oxidase [bacterium]|nr:MAG: pyridoxamine 5'-phosphate oxidase [bacterium]